MKKTIKCKFVSDIPMEKRVLEERFLLAESENPDFVFGRAGDVYDMLRYDCVRILFIGENVRPDFNLVDYAYGFDRIKFENRNLYWPLYATGYCEKSLNQALQKHLYPNEYYLQKKNFCNIIVTNLNSASDKRYQFFKLLNDTYQQVDSAGGAFNNLSDGKPVKEKQVFCEKYRFTIAFENSSYQGYTTEKIIDAWAAGTIPIYWGDPSISEQFNEKAFINCHNYNSFEEVVEEIKRIDNDEQLYLQMQKEPIYLERSNLLELTDPSYFREWIYHILEQEPKAAIRRTNAHDGWGYEYEKRAKRHYEMDHIPLVKAAYKIAKATGRSENYFKDNNR